VFLYGKPHPPIYAEARRRLGDDPSRRVVAVGDLLETDIRGARNAGFPCVLVTRTGAHAADVTTAQALEALFAREGIAPDMVLERFAW
jgi:ribonucleotide monophosphatase NagD (HAD superfamily)